MNEVTDPEISQLIAQAEQASSAAECCQLLARACALADAAGQEGLAYQARVFLISAALQAGDTDTMITCYAWCLGKHDQDPVRFPAETDHGRLLWMGKWMPGRLIADPRFSLTQIEAVLTDLRRRYRQAGVGLSGVLQTELLAAMGTGDLVAAGQLRQTLRLTATDDLSDCEACQLAVESAYHRMMGDRQASLACLDELHQRQLRCMEEPQLADSRALLDLLREGRLAEAGTLHQRSYRLARTNPANLTMVVEHWQFCALTQNPARGLMLLERHLVDVMHDPADLQTRFAAAAKGALLLDLVAASGQPETPIKTSDHPRLRTWLGEHEGPWTAADLASRLWGLADQLACEFDHRNQNTWFAQRLACIRGLALETYPLPVPGAAAPLSTPVPPVPAAASDHDWLERAREWSALDHPEQALAALDQIAGQIDPWVRATALRHRIHALLDLGEDTSAQAVLDQRITLLLDLGMEARADAEQRLGLDHHRGPSRISPDQYLAELTVAELFQTWDLVADLQFTRAGGLALDGDLEAALAGVHQGTVALDRWEQAAARSAAETTWAADLRDQAHCQTGWLLCQLDRVEQAREVLIRVRPRPGNRILRRRRHTLLALAHLKDQDLTQASAEAELALAISVALADPAAILASAELAGQCLSHLDQDASAADRLRYGISQAEPANLDTTQAKASLAQYQAWAGLLEEAFETWEDLHTALVEAGASAEELCDVMMSWAGAAWFGGQPDTAHGAFQRALDHALAGQTSLKVVSAATHLAQLLTSFEDAEAIEVLDRAMAWTQRFGDRSAEASLIAARGLRRCELGDEGGLVDAEQALALAASLGEPWLIPDLTDSQARGLAALGRWDDAIPLALRAADGHQAVGQPVQAARAEQLAAGLLQGLGRTAEARACLTSAVNRDGLPPSLVAELEEAREQLS